MITQDKNHIPWNKNHIPSLWKTRGFSRQSYAYVKSIGTLSQIFKKHIVTVAFKWCVLSASDVFLSKNDNSDGKTRESSKVMEYDFYFTEYDFCPDGGKMKDEK
jgi:hypothetical protein